MRRWMNWQDETGWTHLLLYSPPMKSLLLLAAVTLALFLNGCADDLTPEVTDRPPAAHSPDFSGVLPQQETARDRFQRGGY